MNKNIWETVLAIATRAHLKRMGSACLRGRNILKKDLDLKDFEEHMEGCVVCDIAESNAVFEAVVEIAERFPMLLPL